MPVILPHFPAYSQQLCHFRAPSSLSWESLPRVNLWPYVPHSHLGLFCFPVSLPAAPIPSSDTFLSVPFAPAAPSVTSGFFETGQVTWDWDFINPGRFPPGSRQRLQPHGVPDPPQFDEASHRCPLWLQHPSTGMFLLPGSLTQQSQLWFSILKGLTYVFHPPTRSQQVSLRSAIRTGWLKVTL